MTALDQDLVNDFVGNAHGNLERVRELLEAHPELLNARAVWDESALEAASQTGSREIAELLLSRGAPLDIYAASMLGLRDEVQRFLDDDPSLATSRGVHGLLILCFPAVGGQLEIARLLRAYGATVDDADGGSTPLHAAVQGGSVEMVEWLLAEGADATRRDYEGKTPFERAEAMGREDLAGLLREKMSSADSFGL